MSWNRVDTCPECHSDKTGLSPTGAWCNKCGWAEPGYKCERCGREGVNEHHIDGAGLLCRVIINNYGKGRVGVIQYEDGEQERIQVYGNEITKRRPVSWPWNP